MTASTKMSKLQSHDQNLCRLMAMTYATRIMHRGLEDNVVMADIRRNTTGIGRMKKPTRRLKP